MGHAKWCSVSLLTDGSGRKDGFKNAQSRCPSDPGRQLINPKEIVNMELKASPMKMFIRT